MTSLPRGTPSSRTAHTPPDFGVHRSRAAFPSEQSALREADACSTRHDDVIDHPDIDEL